MTKKSSSNDKGISGVPGLSVKNGSYYLRFNIKGKRYRKLLGRVSKLTKNEAISAAQEIRRTKQPPAPSITHTNENLTLESPYEKILEYISGTADPPLYSPYIKSVTDKVSDITPIILWSDWHIGETIKKEQLFGYNEFNEHIAQKRADILISKTISLIQHESNSKNVVLWLGGDFVSGWLHEENLITDWCSPLEAIHWACEILYNLISDLSTVFENINILCSPGNHGRLLKRPPAKELTATSYDWLIYSQLKSWFRNNERVEFSIPAEGDCLLTVNNHTMLFTHGNNLGVEGRGNAEIGILGPICRGRNRIASSLSPIGIHFSTMVLGHFHQDIWVPGRGIIVNPAFCGYNEYAKSRRYPPEPPAQSVFFIHKEYGPIIPLPVFLDR